MNSRSTTTSHSTADEEQVRLLHQELLAQWNQRNANGMANLFAEDGNLVGFDGSQVDGRSEIAAHLRPIFASHPTAAYVGIVREVRLLSPDVAILRAVVGMVPPGQSDINPAVNAIQSLVAIKEQREWHAALFQNTPLRSTVALKRARS